MGCHTKRYLGEFQERAKKKTPKTPYVKVPQTPDDLVEMKGADLRQWIGIQGVPVGDGYRNKTQALALAEKVWDAKETATLDNLKKIQTILESVSERHGTVSKFLESEKT